MNYKIANYFLVNLLLNNFRHRLQAPLRTINTGIFTKHRWNTYYSNQDHFGVDFAVWKAVPSYLMFKKSSEDQLHLRRSQIPNI